VALGPKAMEVGDVTADDFPLAPGEIATAHEFTDINPGSRVPNRYPVPVMVDGVIHHPLFYVYARCFRTRFRWWTVPLFTAAVPLDIITFPVQCACFLLLVPY